MNKLLKSFIALCVVGNLPLAAEQIDLTASEDGTIHNDIAMGYVDGSLTTSDYGRLGAIHFNC